MKKGNSPLIVAVFLVVGGLLSGIPIFSSKAGNISVASVRRDTELFISTAQGAMNTATLFGARIIPPVSAVSGGDTSNPKLLFSATLGTVKDPGIFISNNPK